MRTGELFRRAQAQMPLAILARKEVAGAAQADTQVAAYNCETAGVAIFTNQTDAPYSPIDGETMIATASTGNPITISSAEFDQLSKIATCRNVACACDLYASPELASKLVGQSIHCVTCGESNEIASVEAPKAEAEVAGKKVDKPADEAVAGETPATETTVAAADETTTVAAVEDKTPEAAAAEAAAAVIEEKPADTATVAVVDKPAETTEAAAAVAAIAAEEKPVDKVADKLATAAAANETAAAAETAAIATAGDDEEEDEDDEDSYDDVDFVPDDDEEDEEEEASLKSTATIDLSSQFDVDTKTITLAKVVDGHVAMFALDIPSNKMQHLGDFRSETASEANRPLYSNLDKMKLAVTAAVESASLLTEIGFQPLMITVDVAKEYEGRVTAAAETASTKATELATEKVKDFEQGFEIASMGMNKGMFENPLVSLLTQSLERRHVHNAAKVAVSIITAASDDYCKALLDKAKELASLKPEAREAVATTVASAKSIIAADDDTSLPISTAAIIEDPVRKVPAPKSAPAKEVATESTPARNGRRMFSNIGYGTGIR